MKIALVHDYIKEYGGAERVLEALHELYPKALVFTSVYLPDYLGPHKARFANWDIKTSLAQGLPFKAKLISPLRLISPLLFNRFDFSKFDVVIVSATGAYFPNMIRKGKALHICYCHTPPRYLYGYATARDWQNNVVMKTLGALMGHMLRMVDYNASQKVDYYIANSEEIAGRIKKFYRKDAVVIYPPVTSNSESRIQNSELNKKKTYYVAGGRLARAKRIDVAVKACTALGLPLKVFGKAFAGYGEELKRMAGPTVEFVGEVSDEEKYELMAGAKAFLFTAEDEDFGITPVEAMAAGTPVIAYRSGGVTETVIDGKTGLFFAELTSDALQKAIKQFEKMHVRSADCRRQAEKFSTERFQKEIAQLVQKLGK
jgi:glycosyltransferase involved in cell wall biosynthesis